MPDPPRPKNTTATVLTVGELRSLLETLPAHTPLALRGTGEAHADVRCVRVDCASPALVVLGPSTAEDAALFAAVEKNDRELVRQLVEGGYKVDARDPRSPLGDGASALTLAAGEGRVEMVELLLDLGADVDAASASGWTALMRAANNGEVEAVRMLLERGADAGLVNREGYTAFGRVPGNHPDLRSSLKEAEEQAAARAADLAAHLEEPTKVQPFESWAWSFSRWGKRTMVRAALTAARWALPVWEAYVPPDEWEGRIYGGPEVRAALDAVEASLQPGSCAREALETRAELCRASVDQAASYAEEAGGDVARRERALTAGQAALAAAEAAVWRTPRRRLAGEEPAERAEVEAQIAAGPALHVVQAFAYACLATEGSAAALRAELRRSLLGQPGPHAA
jgi:hypothetical protein